MALVRGRSKGGDRKLAWAASLSDRIASVRSWGVRWAPPRLRYAVPQRALPDRHENGQWLSKSDQRDIPVLILPKKPEFDLLFPNFLVISHLEYLLKIEE